MKAKSAGGLGFRDLESFNLVMLAKQGWRLTQNPNSLAAHVLQQKFYPEQSFLQAKLGYRPSYIWISILAIRHLLNKGLFWGIGNGEQTLIWQDKWIPKPFSFKIQSAVKILDKEAKVNELIDCEVRTWRTSLIDEIFPNEEAKIIKKIPISLCSKPDKIIWKGISNGQFIVRNAYHMHKEM